MPRRYAARTDPNHASIRDLFRKLGALVLDTYSVGGGFPDLVVGCKAHGWMLVEVKDGSKPPSERKLKPSQAKLIEDAKSFGCKVHVVESEADVYALMGARVAA